MRDGMNKLINKYSTSGRLKREQKGSHHHFSLFLQKWQNYALLIFPSISGLTLYMNFYTYLSMSSMVMSSFLVLAISIIMNLISFSPRQPSFLKSYLSKTELTFDLISVSLSHQLLFLPGDLVMDLAVLRDLNLVDFFFLIVGSGLAAQQPIKFLINMLIMQVIFSNNESYNFVFLFEL